MLFIHGVTNRTDGTYTANLQESDDDSTWSDVPDDRIQGSEGSGISSNSTFVYGVHTSSRYVRCQVISTSVTTGATIYVAVVKGEV